MSKPRQRAIVKSAAPRSLYRKIQIVLAESRRGRAKSRKDLVEQIERRGHADFTRYRVAEDYSVHLVPCSPESIDRVVATCVSLGLVDKDTAALTDRGLKAADPQQFDKALRQAIMSTLASLGAPLPQIKQLVSQLLASAGSGPLPTWDALYDGLNLEGGGNIRKTFRSYLSLLAECGGIAYSRKKLYLPSNLTN
jgi:hypothetical protein